MVKNGKTPGYERWKQGGSAAGSSSGTAGQTSGYRKWKQQQEEKEAKKAAQPAKSYKAWKEKEDRNKAERLIASKPARRAAQQERRAGREAFQRQLEEKQRAQTELILNRRSQLGLDKYEADRKAAAQAEQDKPWWQKMAENTVDAEFDLLPGVNIHGIARDFEKDTSWQEMDDRWDEEHRQEFGYRYLQNPEDARDYATEYNDYLNRLEKQQKMEALGQEAVDKPWLSTAKAIGAQAMGGIGEYANDIAENLGRGRITERGSRLSPTEYAGAITGAISEDLNRRHGTLNEDVPVFGGKGWGDVYQLGTSVAQSMLSARTLGGLGTLVSYFGQAAASSVDDARRRGARDDEALVYGALSGLAEGLAEQINIKQLQSIGSAATMRELMQTMAKQGLSEGIEEGVTSVLNTFADNLVLQDKSLMNIRISEYMAGGMTEEEARRRGWMDAVEDTLFDMFGGFASGGVSGGIQTGINTGVTNFRYGEATLENMMALVQEGMAAPEGSAARTMAQEYEQQLFHGRELNGVQIQRLAQELWKQEQATEQAGTQQEQEESPIVQPETMDVREEQAAQEGAEEPVATVRESRMVEDDFAADTDVGDTDGELAEDMNVLDTDEDILAELSDLGLHEEEARVLRENFRDTDLDRSDYVTGVRTAFQFGQLGIPARELERSDSAASVLAEHQRITAYKYGQLHGQQLAQAEQKALAGKSVAAFKNVDYEGDWNKLNDAQTAGIYAVNALGETLGIRYRFYESYQKGNQRMYLDENGVEKKAPNGFYKDGVIHLDVNAGSDGQGTVLFTAAHEMTHFIREWSPEKFRVLADTLMEGYAGQDTSVEQLISEKMAAYQKSGESLSFEQAFEEVVADSMETMLADGSFAERVQKLKQTDRTLWEKIRDWFVSMAEDIRKAYEGLKPDSREGQLVAEMVDTAEKLKDLFAEAAADAAGNLNGAEKNTAGEGEPVAEGRILTDDAVTVGQDGTRYSLRSMKKDIAEGQMFEDLKNHCGWTPEQTEKLKNDLQGLVEYMMPHRDILDMNESYDREGRKFFPYKPNSDPLYKISMDFSTLCSKRLLTQYVIENLQVREGRPMSAEEQMAIRDMLNEYRKQEKGLQVACAMCYVEAARLKSPKQISRWIEDPEAAMKDYFAKKNPEFRERVASAQAEFKRSRGYSGDTAKKGMKPKDVRELNLIGPRMRSEYRPSDAEQAIISRAVKLPSSTYLTAGNLANLSEAEPEIYEAYTTFIRNATRSKSLETDEPYYYGDSRRDNGNGIVVTDTFIENVNRENGMRFSSWSDWRIQHMLDYIIAVIDNSVRGAAMHGYTKFPEEVRVLGKTGMMFNMSGVAGTQTGLNLDGSLSFSETESIDVNEAVELREQFPDTAGLQCIGVSDAHITALLRSDIIDYVIPYHTSGLNAGLRRMANIHGWKDYTSTQHAAVDKSIRKEDAADPEHWHEEPVYSEFFVGYDADMTGIEAMQASAERYKQMCRDRGLKPKFEKFAEEDGYWKLLIDRKMVNQKTGELIRQKPVSPEFDFGEIRNVVDRYVENYDSGLEVRALRHITENWDSVPDRIRDLKKQKKASKAAKTLANQTMAAMPVGTGEMLSLRDPEHQEVQEALKQENEKLRKDVANLKELVKLQRTVTNGTKFTKTSVEAAAGMLMEKAGVSRGKQELAPILEKFYAFIASNDGYDWPDVAAEAQEAVDWLLEHRKKGTGPDDYSREILGKVRSMRIQLNDAQAAEAASLYGSVNEYRKRMMGSVVVSKDGTALDEAWQELAALYPGTFGDDVTDGDMPVKLAEIIGSLRRNEAGETQWRYEQEMLGQELVREVYDSYWQVSNMRTFADVKQKEIDQLKLKHFNQMDRLRTEYREKVAQLKAGHRDQIAAIRKEHREAMEKQAKDASARYQESRKKASESRHRTEMRHKIQKQVKKLNDLLLKEDKDHHVPESMKRAVADALDVVNMDTVGAQARIEELDRQIAKAKTEEKKQELMERRLNVSRMGGRMDARLASLKAAYETIRAEGDGYAYDEVIASKIQETVEAVGNTALRDMNMAQLEAVHDLYKAVTKSISTANKAFKAARGESITQLGSSVMEEVQSVGGSHKESMKLLEDVKSFGWNNLKPEYAMRAIGSETLSELFGNVRAGEDTWAKDVNEAKAFYQEKAARYGYRKWDLEETRTFASRNGLEFQLNLPQMMSLYAYSKREQADQHLQKGGFVFDTEAIRKEKKHGVTVEKLNQDATAYNLGPEELGAVVAALTKEQKAFVDEMQAYLSDTMGAKGNEVSMALYDIRLFKEKNYFPLKSARQFLFQQTENTGEVRLKNSGFSKKTTPKAGNPVILTGFMDVWANHVNDMSMYHAFVLPLEDFNRVFNYRTTNTEDTDSSSVKAVIQNAYGVQAERYIRQLLTDLNGGARVDPTTGFINKMMGKFKKGAVFASMSVVVQQPSAIGRAMAVIDPKYFGGEMIRPRGHKLLWEEVKKYAPVALIKEMGYFDTNMGRSTVDYITAEEYSGLKEKVKGFFADSGYRDELLSVLPALADEISWCYIWQSVKRETAAKHKGMDPGSEEFLTLAGKRFTEVIVRTQVYDSVLSRSANMRSKDTGMKMATAFLAEPTTSINMAQDALLQAKRGDKKYARRAIGSVIASQILNACLVSFVYALRDDDEDESYGEKYMASFVGNVVESMNPLTYLPFVKDIVSIVQGYEVERTDMAVIGDLVNAWRKLGSDKLDPWEKVEQFAGALAQMFGLPLKNIIRDARGIWQTAQNFGSHMKITGSGAKNAIIEGVTGSKGSQADRMYQAALDGDTEYVDRLKGLYKDDTAAKTAMTGAIRDALENEDITEEEAMDHLEKLTGRTKEESRAKVQYWQYKQQDPEGELSESALARYHESVESSGISLEQYAEFLEKLPGNATKEETMAVIQSMKLTRVQKDALYRAQGYAESTIGEAPWH